MWQSSMVKTTVYLDASAYRTLKQIARHGGTKPAQLIREAVTEYAARRSQRPLPRSVGAGDSGLGDVSQRDEDYLEGLDRKSVV